MLFRLYSAENKNGSYVREPLEIDFKSLDDALKYMLDNSFKFSNWSILRDDIGMIVYVPTAKIAAFVYFNSKEVTYPSWDWRE